MAEDKLIEIQREIDRKMGNMMVIDKIRSGAYRLKTGEAEQHEMRDKFYSERFDEEFKGIVEHVNEEEGLGLQDYQMRNHASNLQRQMSEGRKTLSFWVRGGEDKGKKMNEGEAKNNNEDEDEDEGKDKKKLLFFD